MSAAAFTARLIGPLFVAIGLGILINAPFYVGAVVEAVHSPTLVYLSGVATLLAGLAVVNTHRAWTADWRVIVTILGWIFVIAGILRIVLPELVTKLATTVFSGTTALSIAGAIVLVIGGFLSFKGYQQTIDIRA
jgi:uncharacterized protein YjeT (DUF2065 family)